MARVWRVIYYQTTANEFKRRRLIQPELAPSHTSGRASRLRSRRPVMATVPRAATAIIAVAVEEESRRIRENYRTPRKYIVGLSGWLGRSCIEADYR